MTTEMLSVTTPSYSDPSAYQLITVARPTISEPNDVLIKVHAASINPVDVKKAAGVLKLAIKDEFPYKIGYDCAGIVDEIGENVTRFKVGDEVYTRLPESHRGSLSEYAKSPEEFVAQKPKSLSFGDAASLPLAAMTALQALRQYKGSLEGKIVLIPGGLSGTGSYACQLAKNEFNAGKVITTVSTAKVDQIPLLLGEGVVDQVIDYTKDDPMKVIAPRSVDFVFDTTGQAMEFLSLMVPSTSAIISISTQPSGTVLQNSSVMKRPDNPRLPWFVLLALNLGDAIRKARAWRWSVRYEYLFLNPNAADLECLSKCIEDAKLRPVVGTRVNIRDIEAVRKACDVVYRGKGGIGKAVIEVIEI